MRNLLLTALFVGSPLLAFGQEVKILDKYTCHGTGQNGEYTTALTITQKGDNYFLNWDESRGMGFRMENDLVAVWILDSYVGVVFYKITDGRLMGFWAGGDGKVYAEICTAGILVKGGQNEQQDTEPPEGPSAVRGA